MTEAPFIPQDIAQLAIFVFRSAMRLITAAAWVFFVLAIVAIVSGTELDTSSRADNIFKRLCFFSVIFLIAKYLIS